MKKLIQPGADEASGFAGLLSEVKESSYRALAWTAAVAGALSLFNLAREILERFEREVQATAELG